MSTNAIIYISLCVALLLVSLPLFIGIGYIMKWYLKDKSFEVRALE